MKRYLHLIQQELANGSNFSDLGRKLGVPPMSIVNYTEFNREPRLKALEGMTHYFREPIAALLLEHEPNNDYETMIELLRRIDLMSAEQREKLLAAAREIK